MAMRRILAVVTNPGNGVREDTAGADGRGREAPTAAGAAATSSLTSVRVTTRSRRRTNVLDRQRQKVPARRADLDAGVHLGVDAPAA
ncbi:hypothetical protein OK006_4213 [Actinobacteria bacterium OK006]|nr:hypothetical protein OK006_4213 [Actinobacteria bacterium OK006]